MKKIIVVLVLTSSILFACKTTKTQTETVVEYTIQGEETEGDLYFGWLRIGNLYNKDVGSAEDIQAVLDTTQVENVGADSVFLNLYKALNERELLYAPYIEVVIENDRHTTWYLSAEDYETIKKFRLKDLNDNNKKVHITADLEHVYQNAFKCNKILKVELLSKDNFKNSDEKFNTEDYK